VVLAIVVGIAISFTAQYAANRLSLELLMPAALKAGTIPPPIPRTPSPFLYSFVIVWQAVMFFVLGGGIALRSYFNEPEGWREAQRQREQEVLALRHQKSEVDMRLAVLQAQVEPHFLFNTLASVHSLISNDPRRAEATIEALVDHLRATLPKLRAGVGSPVSTLAEQLEVCASYLSVMKVRMGDRLSYDIDALHTLREHPFPPYMLISLVENAVKHGIEPSAAGGRIVIRAALTRAANGQSLEVTVQDDGVGLRPGLGDGVGLANVRAQLSAQFGAHGRFTIEGGANGGVAATIAVPFVEAAT
jgi:sensor histidine kinase YesM